MNKKSDNQKAGNHIIRLHIKAGMANPAPPVGPALSQWKVNIMAFCKAFNDETQSMKGSVLPVDIIVSPGGKYTFKVGKERAGDLIRKALGIEKGCSNPGREVFKEISREQLREIAKYKNPDMTAFDEEGAINTLAGTARSMGIKVIS